MALNALFTEQINWCKTIKGYGRKFYRGIARKSKNFIKIQSLSAKRTIFSICKDLSSIRNNYFIAEQIFQIQNGSSFSTLVYYS